MKIRNLQRGDTFVECSSQEWAAMTPSDRKKQRRVTLDHAIGACRTAYDRIHLKTSAGDWCISLDAPVTRLESSAAKRQQESAA